LRSQPEFFALIYNAVGIPLAAGVLYPVLGCDSRRCRRPMALSSPSLGGNANRLRRYHVEPLPPAAPPTMQPRVEVGAAQREAIARQA
jgi:Cu+-exporting ATPase